MNVGILPSKKRSLKGKMEKKMEQFPAKNPNPVLGVANDGTVLYSNVAGEPLLHEWGVEVGEKLPSNIGDLVRRVISQNIPEKMEVIVGKRVYLVAFHPLPEEECVNIYGFDISDQKKFERELMESEIGLSEAQRMAHIGNWDWNIVENKVYWSDEMYRIFGRSPQECITYDKFLTYVHPDDKNYVCNPTKDALNGKIRATEYRIVRPDGEERIVHSEREVIFDERNNPVRMRGTVQDVTKYIKAKEKLRESEEKYRNIVEIANEGIWVLDAETRTTYVNEKMAEMLGYSQKEMIGRLGLDFVNEKNEAHTKLRMENRRHGIDEVHENELVSKDGSSVWVLVSSKSLFNTDGKFTGFLAMLTDITERKQTQLVMKADLEALTRMHVLSGKLLGAEGVQPLLQEIMDTAVAIMDAKMGVLQLLEDDSLWIVAHYGHQQPFLEFFSSAENRASVCGEAMQLGGRVVVEDVETSSLFVGTPSLDVMRNAGVRAVQSTPMLNRAGKLLGILTIQWDVPYSPNEHDLWRIDLLARQAADMIEQARTKKMLRESEERFRALVTASSEVLYRMSPDWSEMRQLHSRGFLANTEKPSRTWLQEYIPPDDQPHVTAVINEAIRTKSIFELEHRVRRADGSLGWTFSRAVPLLDANGEIVEWFGAASDITERKRMEETLLAKDAELQLIADATPILLTRLSRDLHYIFVNRACAEMFGRTREEIVGKPIVEIMGKEAFETIRPYVEKVLQGQRVEYETEIPYQGVSTRFMHAVYIPERNGQGEVVGWLASISDITERKQAEEALHKANEKLQAQSEELQAFNDKLQARSEELHEANEALLESEERFRTMANAIPQLAWMARPDGYIYWYNERWYAYTGTTPEQMEGWGWQSVHDPAVLPKVLEQWKASIASGQEFDMEFPLRGADGLFRQFLTRVFPLKDAKGQVLQWFGTNTDITERKRREDIREAIILHQSDHPFDPRLRRDNAEDCFRSIQGNWE